MKRTIKRRTEITIQSLEITTIRHMRSALTPDARSEDGTTHLPIATYTEQIIPTRMEGAKKILRRGKK